MDFGFLRHNDHTIQATVLVAAVAGARAFVPDPDPIGVVYFADADSVFAQAENLKDALRCAARARPTRTISAISRRGRAFRKQHLAACRCSPGDITAGTLGFVKIGDREWLPEELNALKAIASLFAQLQARIVAENRLLYLAEHDDLTDLLNRRALIAHLDERLVVDKLLAL